MEKQHFTVAGTNIDEVKQLNAQSGLSYNQVKEVLAKTTNITGAEIYGHQDFHNIRKEIEQSMTMIYSDKQ
ncbi:gamma-type small acid-soluble spore protein [Bacillus taeanensis]|uniref:Gamma-type small acid-soluble spore protein n=1 Tax=Bacillus taeanensis TaxID=273032 RepID=A0A366XTM0_9BACI|nr:gamma-type small acid-soluble spore protein [Bacillus taeanensis]RBW69247.1 gamma-type small acid-soluble spore protein [Bacillus taeanensis]